MAGSRRGSFAGRVGGGNGTKRTSTGGFGAPRRRASKQPEPIPHQSPRRSSSRNKTLRRYNPEDFIVPTHNDKDHTDRKEVSLPRDYWTEVLGVINSHCFPFGSIQDFLRWSVKNALETLRSYEPDAVSHFHILEINRLRFAKAKMNIELLKSLEEMGRTVYELIQQGPAMRNEAKKMVHDCLTEARSMPEGAFRDRYIQEIHQRFGEFLKGEQVKFITVEDGEGADGDEDHLSYN